MIRSILGITLFLATRGIRMRRSTPGASLIDVAASGWDVLEPRQHVKEARALPRTPALPRRWGAKSVRASLTRSNDQDDQLELSDLANGFANTGSGRTRMQLDQATVRSPCEQAHPTSADWPGQP